MQDARGVLDEAGPKDGGDDGYEQIQEESRNDFHLPPTDVGGKVASSVHHIHEGDEQCVQNDCRERKESSEDQKQVQEGGEKTHAVRRKTPRQKSERDIQSTDVDMLGSGWDSTRGST